MKRGWKLMPEEPTPEMVRAGHKMLDTIMKIGMPEYDSVDAVELMWAEMVKVAPPLVDQAEVERLRLRREEEAED